MAEIGVDVNTTSQSDSVEIAAAEGSSEHRQEPLEPATDLKEIPWACVRVEEPDGHARRYLEENQILRILETLLAKLVCQKPDKPLEFLVKEMEMMKDGNPPSCTNDETGPNRQMAITEHGIVDLSSPH